MQKLDWVGFWNTDHHIYVNQRHKIVHDQLVTRDIAAYLPEGSAVLDFGCGKNFAVHEMMDKAAQLILCDAASSVREELQGRFPNHPKIMVLAPEELDLLPPKGLRTRDIYIPDLHIDSLRLKPRNFR